MYLGKIVSLALTAAAFATEPIQQVEPVITKQYVLSLGVDAWEGYAPAYSMGLMRKVAIRRGLKPTKCDISTPFGEIGDKFYLFGVNTGFFALCQKADTSDTTVKCRKGICESDRDRHIRTRRYAEIPGELQQKICGHRNEPSIKCPIILVSSP